MNDSTPGLLSKKIWLLTCIVVLRAVVEFYDDMRIDKVFA
jgi:hypothetical protein